MLDCRFDTAIGTPSITYKGSFPAEIDVPPRILTMLEPPGLPLLWMMSTPGALPWISCCGLDRIPVARSSVLSEVMDPVTSRRCAVPYPTTTTSSRAKGSGSSSKSTVTVAPEARFTLRDAAT